MGWLCRNTVPAAANTCLQPTSIGITWHLQPFFTQLACNVLYRFFFRSRASSRFSSQGTVNSIRRTHFFELNHTSMSGHFSVWIMWTGNYRDILRSAETYQSLTPFSSFIFEFFYFLIDWIEGSLAITGCWFTVSHCVLNNSMTTSIYRQTIGIVECSPIVWETCVQSKVESCQRLKKLVIDTSLLNTQLYKGMLNTKLYQGWVQESKEMNSTLLHTLV